MKCAYSNFDPETGESEPECQDEATHDRDCSTGSAPVCAAHKCRCSFTLEEAAKRSAAAATKRAIDAQEKAGIDMIVQGAMASYPAGLSCVRLLSHLTTDCQQAFCEPKCPQCRITAGVWKAWDARAKRDAGR